MAVINHSTVVIALNYQNELMHPDGQMRLGVSRDGLGRSSVVEAAIRLLSGARGRGIPVISVRVAYRSDHADVIQNCRLYREAVASRALVDGGWGAAFYRQLAPHPGELIVTHLRTNAFIFSPLEGYLTSLGARRLIIAGIATNSAVESTARYASDIGYDVVVASDACSARDLDMHAASLSNLALLADVAEVASVIG